MPSGRWRRVLTDVSVHLYGEAVERLVNVDESGYWRQLAENLELSPLQFARYRAEIESRLIDTAEVVHVQMSQAHDQEVLTNLRR